jgi:hypothetical protein
VEPVIVFGFGVFRPHISLDRVIDAVAAECTKLYRLSPLVGPTGVGQDADTWVFIDISSQLQSLDLESLGHLDRLFILQSGPTPLNRSLRAFLNAVSGFHRTPTRMILDHADASVYSLADEDMFHHLGFRLESDEQIDARPLASALFREYYQIRVERLQRQRTRTLLQSISAGAAAAESDREAAASHFIRDVLKRLDLSYATTQLLLQYTILRARQGQELVEALEDLLPMAFEQEGYQPLFESFQREFQLFSMIANPPAAAPPAAPSALPGATV